MLRPKRNRDARRASAFVVAALVTLAACNRPPDDPEDYVSQILSQRAAKDEAFRVSDESPIPEPLRDEFLPLSYFPPDPGYRVPAALRPAPQPRPVVQMPTSTGRIRSMERIGTLEFTLNAKPLSLEAFAESGTGIERLFVPFTDLTTGTETYAAGRYLDLDRTATGIYNIDFNQAYNPYCYFSPEYDCPFPPPSNRLQTPVRAGERLPETEPPT